MKILAVLSLATIVGLSEAGCPNSCSGHGTCGVDEVVSCFLSSGSFPRSIFSHLYMSPHLSSALVSTDGVPMAWQEEIALKSFVRLNLLGSTRLKETELGIDMPSVPTKEPATETQVCATASRVMKVKHVRVNRARIIVQVMALVST